jgi:putative oxidoreductase
MIETIQQGRNLLRAIPDSVLALAARAATAAVFLSSGLVKLSDWSATQHLFESEYHLLLLPPDIAAYMATTVELGGSALIILGLFTRVTALGFIGMTLVIQTLIYPQAWPTHMQWLAFLLFLVARGGGVLSLDALIARKLGWTK